MRPRIASNRRGFTLLELLIVVAIIGVLATLLLTAISSARKKTQVAVAKSHINAIKAALAAYETDMGRYPRLNPIPSAATLAEFRIESPALYVALRNQPGRGGGPNSPYLQDWNAEDIGTLRVALTNGAIPLGNTTDGSSGADWEANGFLAERLSGEDREDINDLSFQADHDPMTGSEAPLVLLDPWGQPFNYREWSSVRKSVKNALPTSGQTVAPYGDPGNNPGQPVIDGDQKVRARNPEGFDLWSNGPNLINEWGHPDSDDVCSWR